MHDLIIKGKELIFCHVWSSIRLVTRLIQYFKQHREFKRLIKPLKTLKDFTFNKEATLQKLRNCEFINLK